MVSYWSVRVGTIRVTWVNRSSRTWKRRIQWQNGYLEMSEYKKVLFKWAERYLEEGAVVTDVTIRHEDGYYYSSLTYQDPYDDIRIEYKIDNKYAYIILELDELPKFGELLSELFALAERENNE